MSDEQDTSNNKTSECSSDKLCLSPSTTTASITLHPESKNQYTESKKFIVELENSKEHQQKIIRAEEIKKATEILYEESEVSFNKSNKTNRISLGKIENEKIDYKGSKIIYPFCHLTQSGNEDTNERLPISDKTTMDFNRKCITSPFVR